MAIYMKVDGIDGLVSAKGYEKWIELDSLNFGVQRNITTKPGNVSDRETSKPTIHEFTIGKVMDKTSPNLFSEACVGKAKSSVQIHVCQTGDTISPYMQYTLSNVLISNYQVSATNKADKAAPEESVTLNFDKIEMKYTPYDESHKASSPIPAGYDLSSGTKI